MQLCCGFDCHDGHSIYSCIWSHYQQVSPGYVWSYPLGYVHAATHPFNFLFRVDCYESCWLCAHSHTFKTSSMDSRKSVVIRGCLIDNFIIFPLPQIARGFDATPTQPVIYPLNLPSIQWREHWCKAFLTTVKRISFSCLNSAQGPSFLGSLLGGDTGTCKCKS